MTRTVSDPVEQRLRLLDAWVETRRRIARLEAAAAQLLADRLRLHDDDVRENSFHRDTIERSMIAEYSAAGHVAKGTVERAFADAAFLDAGHPALRESFRRGAITAAHVHEVIEAGDVVRQAIREGRADAEVFGLYETAAVVAAEADTPARTRVTARQIAAALVGETVTERQRRAKSERCVTMRSVGDGLALLQLVLPEHLAVAILDRLTQLARQLITMRPEREPVLDPAAIDSGEGPIYPDDFHPADPIHDIIHGEDGTFAHAPERDIEHLPDDERTIDEVRADLATDLLLASDPSEAHGPGLDGIRARVQVTIAGSTLSGADDRPAELDGHGPIDPDIARALAGRSSSWSRLFLDPTGMVTETDSYAPTEGMRRFLRAPTSTADSPDAACRCTAVRSTTITTTPRAAAPRSATSACSAPRTTCSSIPTSTIGTAGPPASFPTGACNG